MSEALVAVLMRAVGIVLIAGSASIMADDLRVMAIGAGAWAWTEGTLAERGI